MSPPEATERRARRRDTTTLTIECRKCRLVADAAAAFRAHVVSFASCVFRGGGAAEPHPFFAVDLACHDDALGDGVGDCPLEGGRLGVMLCLLAVALGV